MFRVAQRHRGPNGRAVPWFSSTSIRLTRRPRLRTVVTMRIGPGSGAHRKFPDKAIG